MWQHPAHAIALGFGSGLSPKAPGTVGSLWGWASWLLICARVPVVALYMLWWKSCKCSCDYYINDEEHYNNDDENRVTVLEEKYNQIQSNIDVISLKKSIGKAYYKRGLSLHKLNDVKLSAGAL
jgi:hypothetical protein